MQLHILKEIVAEIFLHGIGKIVSILWTSGISGQSGLRVRRLVKVTKRGQELIKLEILMKLDQFLVWIIQIVKVSDFQVLETVVKNEQLCIKYPK